MLHVIKVWMKETVIWRKIRVAEMNNFRIHLIHEIGVNYQHFE